MDSTNLIEKMADHGLDPGDIVADGNIRRFSVDGDGKNQKSGAYFSNGQGFNWFRDWRNGDGTQKVFNDGNKLSDQAKLLKKCRGIWDTATDPAGHPYLAQKQVQPHKNIRQRDGNLIIPVSTIDGLWSGLQTISGEGEKIFLKGTQKKGCFFPIWGNDKRYIVCEGVATGLSIHEATGFSVAVAFDADNLLPVANNVCGQVDIDRVVIAADNDGWKVAEGKRNVGIEKAKKAASVTGARIAVPIFEKADGSRTTDFNDLFILEGPSAVKALILGAKIVQDSFANVEPLDIFGDTSLVGAPAWSKESCPAAINDFAVDAAQRLGVETPMVAMPAIICAAIAISDTFRMQPKLYDTDWTEPPILWGATVAPPGEKKTPAHDKASAVIKEIQFRYRDEYKEKFAAYKREKARFDALSKQEKAETDPPEKPIMKRKWVDDATMESLRTVTMDNPHGVGIIKDELEGFFSSFDVYKNNSSGAGSKDATDARELFQGNPKSWDRGGGVIFTPNWGASILGTIQPERIRLIAHKMAPGGLLARFLFWEGKQAEEIDRAPDPCCGIYREVIKTLAGLKPQYEKRIFKFDKDGIFCREQLRNICRTIMLMPDTGDPLKAHLNKWEAIFSRLCLVYHLVAAVTSGEPAKDTVESQTVQMVLRLMIDFLLPNSVKFYKDAVGGDNYISGARWIAGHIFDRKPTKLTPRDISRSYRGLNKNKKDLYATMDILDLAGWVEKEEIGKRVFWKVNPMVHTKFADRAKTEIARREENKRQLQESIAKFKNERG